LIQKQYGKSVLAEELNKLVNNALYNFINENKLDILGNPIPKEGEEVKGDFDNPDSFEFHYEIGFAPKFEVPLMIKANTIT
jgi:trigger factor